MSVVIVCGICLWCLSVVFVCGDCLWCLSVVFVCGVCLWCLSVVFVCGVCLSCLSVVPVCDDCDVSLTVGLSVWVCLSASLRQCRHYPFNFYCPTPTYFAHHSSDTQVPLPGWSAARIQRATPRARWSSTSTATSRWRSVTICGPTATATQRFSKRVGTHYRGLQADRGGRGGIHLFCD